MPSAAIEACQLTRFYGPKPAIQNVSFAIEPGTIVGFLGPNAAGKSTTIKILTGLLPATSGSAYILGTSVAKSPQKIYKHLGYLPENNPLPFDLTVLEYLRHRAQLKKIGPKKINAAIERVLENTDLHSHAQTPIGCLSKGFRQRVGIADALIHEPQILILDEPTVGLDPHQLVKFRQWIGTLRGKMTVLISSHLLSEIEALCDHLIIIHHGHIIATGRPTDLRERFIRKSTYRLQFAEEPLDLEVQLSEFLPGIVFEIKAFSATEYHLSIPNDPLLQTDPHLLLAKLAEHPNSQLVGFARLEPTLEDIFLAATQF